MSRVAMSLSLVAFVLTGFSFVLNRVDIPSLKAEQESGYIKVSWTANEESDVQYYKLQRRINDGTESWIDKEIPAKGRGTTYAYIDDAIYKQAAEDDVHYSLYVFFNSGESYVVRSTSTKYISTAARRTWGSIKAMFQ